MSYKLTGNLHKIFDTEQVTETFKKREFVVQKTDGQYPEFIKFQLVQQRCDLLDSYNEGEDVTVDFDLRGREWQGKYFTNLQAWKIAKDVETNSYQPQDMPPPHTASNEFPSSDDDSKVDDMPF